MKQLAVVRRHGFGLLAGSALVSGFGDIIAGLGFLYVAYRQTGSQTATTAVAAVQVIPYLLFGLLGGVLSDSLPKLRVMMVANWYRAILEAVAVLLLVTGTMVYAALLLLPMLIQIGGVIYNPCSRASVLHLVDPEDRVSANSVMSLIDNVTAIAAPLVASAVLALGDLLWVFFLIDALSFVVGALLLRALGRRPRGAHLLVPEPVPDGAPRPLVRTLTRLRLFWSGVGTSSVLVQVFVSTFLTVLCATWAWQIGALFISVPDPRAETWFYSAMLATYAVAGIGMGLALPAVTENLSIKHYRGAVVVWATGLLVMGFADSRPFVALGVLIVGAGTSLASQTRAFLLQTNIPRWAIGQGFAASAVLLYAADALSLVIFGALNHALGPAHTVAFAGGVMIVSLAVGAAVWRLIPVRHRTGPEFVTVESPAKRH